jgi:hypothetical protein
VCAGRRTCILHTGSNSLDELALYVALKGFNFQVLDPPELIPVLRTLAERLRKAAEAFLWGGIHRSVTRTRRRSAEVV